MFSYLQSRVLEHTPVKKDKPGPVVTISREYGCPAKILAKMLTDSLNNSGRFSERWQMISDELLHKAAEELKVSREYIRHVFNYEDRNTVDEILAATRKDSRYKSDRQIKKTIGKVIRSFGEQGHMVIVGRGGVAHTAHIQDAVHIRLQAREEHRIRSVMKSHNCNEDQAREFVHEGDANRRRFLQYYLGETCCNHHFDLIINCERISLEQSVQLVQSLLLSRLKIS